MIPRRGSLLIAPQSQHSFPPPLPPQAAGEEGEGMLSLWGYAIKREPLRGIIHWFRRFVDNHFVKTHFSKTEKNEFTNSPVYLWWKT